MENKKNGVFLGVIGVATLVVAIIGATFAYFSAQTSSNPDAVNVKAYTFSMGLSVEKVVPESDTGIVPLDPDKEGTETGNVKYLEYAMNKQKCIDSNGHQVCQVYKVTFTNNGTNEETLSLQVKTTANEAEGDGKDPFKDLTFQALTGTLEADFTNGTLVRDGNSVLLPETASETIAVTLNSPVKVPATGTATQYFVVYLKENGDQSSQMGASYKGQLIYSSGTGNQLTGTFTA